jgi:hypothetical protein
VSLYIKQAKTQRLVKRSLQVAAVAVMITAGAGYYLGYHHPTRSFYKHVVERWGVPEGVDRRQADEVGGDEPALEATQRGWFGPITEVRLVDRRGRCAKGDQFVSILDEDFDTTCSVSKACVQAYEYGPTGAVTKKEVRDQFGQALETLTYVDSERAILQQAVLSCSRTRSGVQYVVLKRHRDGDAAGMDERVTFHDSRGPRANHWGAYGQAFEYDLSGRRVGTRYLSS